MKVIRFNVDPIILAEALHMPDDYYIVAINLHVDNWDRAIIIDVVHVGENSGETEIIEADPTLTHEPEKYIWEWNLPK